ncbi:unnamed protein product [Gongylonema pulchrum]|uniref:Uncharacterized protein n=1 Tax=Gongylonema pulchrum TaxID=637853 RepID=A0A183D6P0_9BILA|nr:unnamed protein product [Gongylonema pulchrum]
MRFRDINKGFIAGISARDSTFTIRKKRSEERRRITTAADSEETVRRSGLRSSGGLWKWSSGIWQQQRYFEVFDSEINL